MQENEKDMKQNETECNHDCANCEQASNCAENHDCDHDCANCNQNCSENNNECTHDCSTCSQNCGSHSKEDFLKPQNKYSDIKKVIAIMSGKGGVGKSMVTSMLACEMQKKGYTVGILDADITGPSIPKAFGIHEMATGSEECLFPSISKKGVRIMSSNLLLDKETAPIIWRGPVISGLVEQFWTDVAWGELDYLFVDMPPGTGDVPLTVFQSLPVDGIIVVTSPQDLVSMIVEKAVNMAGQMDLEVEGLVENMSYFVCPSCNEKHEIFGTSKVEEIASYYEIDTVAKLPIDPSIPSLCDEGLIEEYNGDYLKNIVNKLEKIEK